MKNKFTDSDVNLLVFDYDIILITESWLDQSIFSYVYFDRRYFTFFSYIDMLITIRKIRVSDVQ